MFKIGEQVVCVKSDWNWYKPGDIQTISSEPFQAYCNEEGLHYTAYNVEEYTDKSIWIDSRDFQTIEQTTPNYAAAFNMWMSDYCNNPQAYEDSHDSAVRHLKEKLNGEEPSYGAVCAGVLVGYLEKVK